MGIAFKAPRAPIERPKLASSRFSFYRRRYYYITTYSLLFYASRLAPRKGDDYKRIEIIPRIIVILFRYRYIVGCKRIKIIPLIPRYYFATAV